MNKLTAEKCRELINKLTESRDVFGPLPIMAGYHLQALEIALPVLEQRESQPTNPQIDNDDWIEWRGGSRPVKGDTVLETRWSDGDTVINRADAMTWEHDKYCNLIAYRVIESGRES